jgi:Uri superfamily endonuclease
MNGSYLIVMTLPNDTSVIVGKRGMINFRKGSYVYVGSALNGLEQRINRHLKNNKKTHWHIDFFLHYAKIINIFYKENNRREECAIARFLEKNFTNIPAFGCSDCYCKSHLFYGFSEEISQVVNHLKMKLFQIDANS